jgi:hypothetical protein
LRRLVADEELVGRRAAGESLRRLAVDYGVAHTTLGRYFRRPEVVGLLREARRGVRVERRALVARRGEQRRLLAQLRRRAQEEAGRRAGRRSWADQLAELAVCAGGGIEVVVEATRLRTRENVLGLIDPAVLVRALENDRAAAEAASGPGRERLRRLCPDEQLLCRRAAGEPLRRLAVDYGVAHTTLGRYFARPEVARQLRELRRRSPRVAAGEAEAGEVAGGSVAGRRRYRRLTAADLELIAHWHVRGASDGMIASELGCERSTVRRARKRPASARVITAAWARQAKRAEAERERARKHNRRQAELARAEQAAAQTAPADTTPAEPASAIPEPDFETRDRLVRLQSPDGTLQVWRDKAKVDALLAQGWRRA